MRPDLDLILTILRAQTPAQPPSPQAWHQALETADQEHILPFFVARLRQSGLPLPEPILAHLTALERDAVLHSFFFTSELKGLLAAFHAAALPVIPLKGPFLAQRLYGNVALRTCRDLDLLVRPKHFPAAAALLASLGFTPQGRPDDYHQGWLRQTTLVELHFDVDNPLALNFSTAQAWSRAQPAHFLGQPTFLLAPADELTYLALHGVRHRFDRLSYSLDMALAHQALAPAIGPTLRLPGQSVRLLPLAALGLQLAGHLALAGTQHPPLHLPLPPRTAAHIRRVAHHIWTHLLSTPGSLPDWQQLHNFYLELQPTRLARLRHRAAHLLILTTRLIEPDYAFAARFGVHRALPVWLLRQLRLLLRPFQKQQT